MKISLRSYPWKKKLDTPCKVGTKELQMDFKIPTPCAPKWKLRDKRLKGVRV